MLTVSSYLFAMFGTQAFMEALSDENCATISSAKKFKICSIVSSFLPFFIVVHDAGNLRLV